MVDIYKQTDVCAFKAPSNKLKQEKGDKWQW